MVSNKTVRLCEAYLILAVLVEGFCRESGSGMGDEEGGGGGRGRGRERGGGGEGEGRGGGGDHLLFGQYSQRSLMRFETIFTSIELSQM